MFLAEEDVKMKNHTHTHATYTKTVFYIYYISIRDYFLF